jgi:tetratricopeptide (TPR) repeat protein/predicted Ser/Thr protein kinase
MSILLNSRWPVLESSVIGKTFSQYKIISKLGGGGMGVVYKAHHRKLDRTVALKFLPHDVSHTSAQRERFLREARAASALDHPNICTIYDIDETADGQTFIAMGFCEGEPLDAVIARKALPIDRAVDIAMKVASGLSCAHGKGIVHRDIKPANIIVTDDGGVKVIDFGIAKLTGQTTVTHEGSLVGTVAYMSPEQAQGGEVDHRVDIWSLGAVLYEMVAGAQPFSGDHAASVIYRILNEEPAPVVPLRRETPEALGAIIHRALQKNPADRFASMEEMRSALETAGSRTVTTATQAVDTSSVLGRARAALARQAWPGAFAAFGEADAQTRLSAEDLDRWATAAVWMNRDDVSIAARERAHAQYVKAEQPARAARAAIELALDNYHTGARSVCNGWLTRAETLLENVPDAVENGYLARAKAQIAIEADLDLDAAMDHAAKALAVAERHGDADLRALATQDRGRVLVLKNRVKEGMALLDEAMATAVSGELSPLVVGSTYCNMISMCEKIADYRRAGEWSDQAVRWCHPHSESPFPGICSVHRAEVMRVRGDWAAAERAASTGCGYTASIAAEAYYVMGEIKLRRGEHREAETSFQEAHRRGRHPAPGMALLRAAQGRLEAARSLIDRALSGSVVDLDRIRLLPAGVEIALAGGDVVTARSRANELVSLAERFESTVFSALAAHAAGAVALAEGNIETALPLLGTAREYWQAANMPYEEARTRVCMATAYWQEGETDLAELEALAASATFERLGAATDLARTDALIAENS